MKYVLQKPYRPLNPCNKPTFETFLQCAFSYLTRRHLGDPPVFFSPPIDSESLHLCSVWFSTSLYMLSEKQNSESRAGAIYLEYTDEANIKKSI